MSWVRLTNMTTGASGNFVINRWLAKGKEDGLTRRTINAQVSGWQLQSDLLAVIPITMISRVWWQNTTEATLVCDSSSSECLDLDVYLNGLPSTSECVANPSAIHHGQLPNTPTKPLFDTSFCHKRFAA